jgi:hypothetical protein
MIKVSQVFVALSIAAVSGVTFGFVSSKADPQSRYQSSVQRIDAQFNKAQAHCQALPPDQLHLCLAVALSQKWRDLADAQIRLSDTPEARRNQRVVVAGGDLLVALQRCNALSAGQRTACRDSAKDTFLREMSRVKAIEAPDQECAPAECAWLPHRAPRALITAT